MGSSELKIANEFPMVFMLFLCALQGLRVLTEQLIQQESGQQRLERLQGDRDRHEQHRMIKNQRAKIKETSRTECRI